MLILKSISCHLLHEESHALLHLFFVEITVLCHIFLRDTVSGKKDMRPRLVRKLPTSVHDQSCLSLDIFFLIKPTLDCYLVDALKFWVILKLFFENS
jgi:hypothetical protein